VEGSAQETGGGGVDGLSGLADSVSCNARHYEMPANAEISSSAMPCTCIMGAGDAASTVCEQRSSVLAAKYGPRVANGPQRWGHENEFGRWQSKFFQ
jgi:hypothetical protein